jgi:hypothetical protein
VAQRPKENSVGSASGVNHGASAPIQRTMAIPVDRMMGARWIYFDSARTGEAQVWKISANGGAEIQVTRKGGFASLE